MNEFNELNLPSSFVDSIWDNAPTEEPARQYYFMDVAKRYVKAMSEKLGRPLLCATKTFGCQMNTISVICLSITVIWSSTELKRFLMESSSAIASSL